MNKAAINIYMQVSTQSYISNLQIKYLETQLLDHMARLSFFIVRNCSIGKMTLIFVLTTGIFIINYNKMYYIINKIEIYSMNMFYDYNIKFI